MHARAPAATVPPGADGRTAVHTAQWLGPEDLYNDAVNQVMEDPQ